MRETPSFLQRAGSALFITIFGCAQPAPMEEVTKEEAAEAVANREQDASDPDDPSDPPPEMPLGDPCETNGWYGDGACDWFCDLPDTDCVQGTLFEGPTGSATLYPILLAHGYGASPTHLSFTEVDTVLRADGHQVYLATVPPYQGVSIRAVSLAEAVDRALADSGAEKLNIIAHSMGGLDSRYLISSLGYGDRIASLTTISTPHRGSRAADVALGLTGVASDEALSGYAQYLGEDYSTDVDDPDLRAALTSLSEANAEGFNGDNIDDARVYYQSWAGVSHLFGLSNDQDDEACQDRFFRNPGTNDRLGSDLVQNALFVGHGTARLPNDGMVRVESAQWGSFRGCVPADHSDIVGANRPLGPDPHTGFDHRVFYRHVVFDLASRGY